MAAAVAAWAEAEGETFGAGVAAAVALGGEAAVVETYSAVAAGYWSLYWHTEDRAERLD